MRDRLGQHVCDHFGARKVPKHAAARLDQVLREQPPRIHVAEIAANARARGDAAGCHGVRPQADTQRGAQAPGG
eukprot:15461661-Alexandrium_andersonii.AAC.1